VACARPRPIVRGPVPRESALRQEVTIPLHRLTRLVLGVPDVDATAAFYRDFGLKEAAPARFASADGGEQLALVEASRRCVVEIGLGVDDPEDLDRLDAQLGASGAAVKRDGGDLVSVDPGTGVGVRVGVAPAIAPPNEPRAPTNSPGRAERIDVRAAAIDLEPPVRPSKLAHVVLVSPNAEATRRFFLEGLGFKLSDRVGDAISFMRCSTDHHNVAVQAGPVSFLHHAAWELADPAEIGRGAQRMVEVDAARHVWGLGRHYIGSNFFWYLRDPAGNFAEYTCDVDVISDGEKWAPGVFEMGKVALFTWGPPPPSSFVEPDDLAELMADR